MSHTVSWHKGYEIRAYTCDVCQGSAHVVPDEDVYATPPLFALLVLDVCRPCLEGGKAEAYVNDWYGEPAVAPRGLCGFCLQRHTDACAAQREEEDAERFERGFDKDLGVRL